MKLNPFLAFLKTHLCLVSGRLHFPRERVGEKLTMEDGQPFVIFRQVVLKPGRDQKVEPGAVFRVRFHVANMSAKQNKLFSLLTIPLFIGLPGFRSKLWLLNEATGDFQGIYEWETLQDAENYAHSFAMKFMTKRSVPGTVSFGSRGSPTRLSSSHFISLPHLPHPPVTKVTSRLTEGSQVSRSVLRNGL